MNRNLKIISFTAVLLMLLAACGISENPSLPPEKVKKTGHGEASQNTPFPGAKKQTADFQGKSVTWWVYPHPNWSKNKEGLKVKIKSIAFTNKIPNMELGKQTPAVKVKFVAHNTSSNKIFDFHPKRTTLSTPKGDIKTDDDITNDTKGKMQPGETKEGTAGFYLDRYANLDHLKWINLHANSIRMISNTMSQESEEEFHTGKLKLK